MSVGCGRWIGRAATLFGNPAITAQETGAMNEISFLNGPLWPAVRKRRSLHSISDVMCVARGCWMNGSWWSCTNIVEETQGMQAFKLSCLQMLTTAFMLYPSVRLRRRAIPYTNSVSLDTGISAPSRAALGRIDCYSRLSRWTCFESCINTAAARRVSRIPRGPRRPLCSFYFLSQSSI